jgi:3-methylfumaryl-CoA hydratase
VTHDYSAWIGRTEASEDAIALAPTLAAAAMLDDTTTSFAPGAALPPLWHWFYFLPKAPQSKIGVDGHPQRGGFMPPIELPRRMFAGARLRFSNPLRIGESALRVSEIRDVSVKEGKSGKLAFVTVKHAISQQGVVCIEEEQDIVYREPGARVPAPVAVDLPAPPQGAWTRTITPDPVLLFRFSALTFNGHRIHYDRDYATQEEGYPGLVVHGPLTAILLLELVRAHTRDPVTAFAFRGQAPLFDLAPFRLVAVPSADRVQLEAQGPDGRVTLAASAELR